jgi:hypothetical protein
MKLALHAAVDGGEDNLADNINTWHGGMSTAGDRALNGRCSTFRICISEEKFTILRIALSRFVYSYHARVEISP